MPSGSLAVMFVRCEYCVGAFCRRGLAGGSSSRLSPQLQASQMVSWLHPRAEEYQRWGACFAGRLREEEYQRWDNSLHWTLAASSCNH